MPAPFIQSGFHGVGEPLGELQIVFGGGIGNSQPVNDQLQAIHGQGGGGSVFEQIGQGAGLSIHENAGESLLLPNFQLGLQGAVVGQPNGRTHHEPRARSAAAGGVHYIADAVALDLPTGDGAVGFSYARPEQFEVVVDFCDRAHCGAAAAGSDPLFHSNGRRQVFDPVDIRLFHAPRKLPDVCTEALDIPSLALCVERIEGQGAFPGPTQACDDGQCTEWNVHIHVFEVVHAGTPDADGGGQFRVGAHRAVFCGGWTFCGRRGCSAHGGEVRTRVR